MKKQKTILIIVLIVAIATAGVYLAVGLVGEQKEQTGDNVNTIVMLTQMENLTYVQYKNGEGTVTLTKNEDTWKCEENENLVLANGYVDEKVAELGDIEGTLVADAVKATCGLEEPAYALTVQNAEQEVKLALGVDEEGRCYAMLEGKSEIYQISEDVIEILNLSADSFVAPNEDMHTAVQDETMLDEDHTTDEDLEQEVTSDTKLEESAESDESMEDATEEESEESDETL